MAGYSVAAGCSSAAAVAASSDTGAAAVAAGPRAGLSVVVNSGYLLRSASAAAARYSNLDSVMAENLIYARMDGLHLLEELEHWKNLGLMLLLAPV